MIKELATGVLSKDHKILAKSITLIESAREKDRKNVEELFTTILPSKKKSIRIGISGPPGVGKSTFINEYCSWFLKKKPQVSLAVITVDPSSPVAGGSILADKSRMAELSANQRAFVRPSPSGQELGGLARRTQEVLTLLEVAGFDYIFIETVGVGQNESTIANLVDLLLLIQMPATGDELQCLKKGLVELADLIIVNKTDDELKSAAKILAATLRSTQSYSQNSNTQRPVILCSSIKKYGFEEVENSIAQLIKARKKDGQLLKQREDQAYFWLKNELVTQIKDKIEDNPRWSSLIKELQKKASQNKSTSYLLIKEALESLQIT